jgi:hypothetical protein
MYEVETTCGYRGSPEPHFKVSTDQHILDLNHDIIFDAVINGNHRERNMFPTYSNCNPS